MLENGQAYAFEYLRVLGVILVSCCGRCAMLLIEGGNFLVVGRHFTKSRKGSARFRARLLRSFWGLDSLEAPPGDTRSIGSHSRQRQGNFFLNMLIPRSSGGGERWVGSLAVSRLKCASMAAGKYKSLMRPFSSIVERRHLAALHKPTFSAHQAHSL